MAASLTAWLLLLPPFSVTPAGKNSVDTGAPLSQWEAFSTLPNATECRKHRDSLREQLDKAAASSEPVKSTKKKDNKKQAAFAVLRERAAAARCISADDPRLRAPAASPTAK